MSVFSTLYSAVELTAQETLLGALPVEEISLDLITIIIRSGELKKKRIFQARANHRLEKIYSHMLDFYDNNYNMNHLCME